MFFLIIGQNSSSFWAMLMISRNARKTCDDNPAFRRNQFEMKRTENITFTNKTRSKHFVTTTRVIYGVQYITVYTKSLSFARQCSSRKAARVVAYIVAIILRDASNIEETRMLFLSRTFSNWLPRSISLSGRNRYYGKYDFAEVFKNLIIDTDLKIILLDCRNNFSLEHNEQCCKKFWLFNAYISISMV